MTDVERVVDPPPSLRVEVAATGRAAMTAARNCGPCSELASLSDLMTAVIRAEREVERSILVEDRFWRRFGRPIEDDSAASTRLAVRRAAARSLAARRAKTLRLLIGPPAGSG